MYPETARPEKHTAATRPPELLPGDVDIWYRLTDKTSAHAQVEARSLLSADERLRCSQYRLTHDRRDYAMAHALLRTSLSRYRDVTPHAWVFKTGVYGKPGLATPTSRAGRALEFNLSHARGIIACAITNGARVGVDVETTNLSFNYADIMSRYCTPDEILRISQSPEEDRATRFIELWTLKEAYIKATGGCLTEAISHVGFQIDGESVRLVKPARTNAGAWQFAILTPAPHYRIGVALESRSTEPLRVRALHLALFDSELVVA